MMECPALESILGGPALVGPGPRGACRLVVEQRKKERETDVPPGGELLHRFASDSLV